MMLNIDEMMKDLERQMEEISVDFSNDYEGCSSYICDAISDYADSRVSIYYGDIEKFITGHFDAVNRAIDEFGWDGCGSDLYKAGQMAEWMENESQLYEDIEEIKKHCALEYLKNLGHTSVNIGLWEVIESALEDIDTNDRMEDISASVVDAWEEWKAEAEKEELPGVA